MKYWTDHLFVFVHRRRVPWASYSKSPPQPSLPNTSTKRSNNYMGKWGLGNPVREDTEEDKFSFKDCGLRRADNSYMWKRHVSLSDMVLFTDKVGGQFLMAVSGPACGLHFLFETMEKSRPPMGRSMETIRGKKVVEATARHGNCSCCLVVFPRIRRALPALVKKM